MLLVAPVGKNQRIEVSNDENTVQGLDKLLITDQESRPSLTSITRRVQTVSRDHNPRFYDLIAKFGQITGDPVVINTSFNVRGEPIVCTPAEAFGCFMRTGMDYLVLENILLDKRGQTGFDRDEDSDWHAQFPLD